jgi:DNA-binding transcriptional regulator YiaG
MSKSKELLIYVYNKGYRVNQDGDVISFTGQIRKPRLDSRGYLTFNINFNKCSWPISVHRLVAYQLYGDKIFKSGIQVRHLNGNKIDNSFKNIAIGTQSDNMMDKKPEDRHNHSKHAASYLRKFTNDQIAEIRRLKKKGLSHNKLAAIYKCTKSTISGIINYKIYR